jgi:hypothetical protein
MKVSQTDPYSVTARGRVTSAPRSSRLKMPQECSISFLLREFASVWNPGRKLALQLVAVTE